jgi:hypothetical protein
LRSRLHPNFRRHFEQLPEDVQQRARDAYGRFSADPFHPGLHFKQIRESHWSVRVGRSYRAVGLRTSDDEIVWYFIGTHDEYERLLGLI